MGCRADDVASALRAAAAGVNESHVDLTALDRAIGDGDHGENLRRGFTAVLDRLDAEHPTTPAEVLKLAAMTLLSSVGGAAGPLYATAFLRAATSAGSSPSLDATSVAAALQAARDGVSARGKAAAGDKTMLDALSPAADAAAKAIEVDAQASVASVLAAAAEAAEAGAEHTIALVARKGRASYLGGRSAGTADPGATSTALILRAIATVARADR